MEKFPVPDAVKRLVLAEKIQVYRNTVYDAGLDARIAQLLDDPRKLQRAEQRIKDALKAIDLLEQLLDDIPKGEVPDGTRIDSV